MRTLRSVRIRNREHIFFPSKFSTFGAMSLTFLSLYSIVAFQLNRPDEETAKLASIVIEKVLALSAAEIRRDTMYVLAAVSTAAKVLAEVDPDSSEAQRGVVQCYALAKRIASDSKQPDELKLDALRCAHKAEYFVFVFRNDYKGMKAILEKDLKAVRDHYRVKKGLEQMSFEESSALFMLAAVLANMEDSSAQSVLEQSIDIFKGISKETITPELEKVWIERITATLTHAYTLEIASHPVPAKEFKRIALALYEQFSRVAVTNTAIPTWKRLETELKQAALANGPP